MLCASCGKDFEPTGLAGRPRRHCLECRPRKVELASPKKRQCEVCGAESTRRYCSHSCSWAAQPRLACDDCGGPTGWKPSQKPEGGARCLSCRRKNPARHHHKPTETWACVRCGVQSSRPATKGQRPAFCRECRSKRTYWITDRERLAIYERDAWVCWLCEESVDPTLIGSKSEWRPSLDHVIPRSKGGDSSDQNLRLAHMWCNVVRGDDRCSPEVFRASA